MRALIVFAVLCGLVPSVDAAPKKTPQGPKALVLVLDRSGSMQGPRMEAARNAALAAIATTNRRDTVAVVAFNSGAEVYVTPQPSSNRKAIESDVARITAGGGTHIHPGLLKAHEILKDLKATTKHVIVLSDGEAPSEGLLELVREMRANKITVSTVAVQGADEQLLREISNEGGGRMHKAGDLKSLSAIFVNETKLALR